MATTERRRQQDVHLPDPAAQKVQDESKAATDALSAQPFMQGVHHIVYPLAAGADVTINHKLGRYPRGWWIADIIGGPNLVYRTAATDKTLTLHNSHTAAVGFALWVY